MTTNVFAAVASPTGLTIKRIRTTQALQNELTGFFEAQATEFLDANLDRVDFDGRYKVDESEIFLIDAFPMSQDILTAVQHPNQCDNLDLSHTSPPSIRAVFAGQYDATAQSSTIWFQAFNRSRLLVGGLTILLQQNTYKKLQEAGLTFDTKLAAVYEGGQLLFRSYSTVKAFLDLTEYFHEATNDEITEVLDHSMILCEDVDGVLKAADGWMRKRFTALTASGILDLVTARKVANKGKKFGFQFAVKKKNGTDALVFPTVKKAAKQLLNFLNEGFFVGELTGTLYQSNSQTRLATSVQ